jgi:hypothetical protein
MTARGQEVARDGSVTGSPWTGHRTAPNKPFAVGEAAARTQKKGRYATNTPPATSGMASPRAEAAAAAAIETVRMARLRHHVSTSELDERYVVTKYVKCVMF